jgi:TonB-linked outer membrane protein, SusC/RagA family
MLLMNSTLWAQNKRVVKGRVLDENKEPLIGATVVIKGLKTTGTMTDINGQFTINVPTDRPTLVVSFLSYHSQEVNVSAKNALTVVMRPNNMMVNEVVVVGFGKQKKESVVGAITQTKGEVLERAGGVSSVGAALTGNLPGVTTTASSGMPGEEDPQIVIRGRSTWNNSDPLVLVDGVERSISSVDINSVESISVLKDASATAVYGVRGGNGVILITTKRGREGKAMIRVGVNSTMKTVSKLPGQYDSYDALSLRNRAIENELNLRADSWNDYLPQDVINKYRYPANVTEAERYPNVDWAKELFKNQTMSYNANIDVSGGTKSVKYFANADFLHEGDLFRDFQNNRGYTAGYGFDRLNVRSNLDFQLTPKTSFRVNLAGSHGVKQSPWGASGSDYSYWIAAYSTAPDVFLPKYSDGTWGYYAPNEQKGLNSSRILAISGVGYTTTNRFTTDFALEQDLKMLVKGLSFRGSVSLDNTFIESGRGISDLYNDTQSKWVDPATGLVTYKQAFDGTSRFDFQEAINWTTNAGSVQDYSTFRKLYYQLQLNYATTIAKKHNITAMAVADRENRATGSEAPRVREDWVFRTTYNYDSRYTIEYNGAYNGSEKFAPSNRFAFFSSGGAGWVISNERFLKDLSFIDLLKLRGSYGVIGDDSAGDRWLYLDQWSYGGQAGLGTTGVTPENSPYVYYKQSAIGNPNIHWEKSTKGNVGLEFEFLKGFIGGTVDYFRDNRSNVLLVGSRRAIPSYFGATAPTANLGKVNSQGYELELRFNKYVTKDLRLYANLNYTHAKDKIIDADDPALLPDYQKKAGKQINQTTSYVSHGYNNSWDQLYGSTIHSSNDDQRLPGSYNIIDYDGNGIIDSKDNVPYGYPSIPQNTYNATLGFEWKGFSGFAQFYGVNNVTRQVVFSSLSGQNHIVYDEGSWWSKDNTNADTPMPRWLSTTSEYSSGNRYFYDGSYVRLKNAELAYTFDKKTPWVKRAGIDRLRIFLNGNNLWVWTKMPDDRESNFAGTGWASQGAYPTVKRFNLGLNVTF